MQRVRRQSAKVRFTTYDQLLEAGRIENIVSFTLKSFTNEGGTDRRSEWTLFGELVFSNDCRCGAAQEVRNLYLCTKLSMPPVLRTPTRVRAHLPCKKTILRTSVDTTQEHLNSSICFSLFLSRHGTRIILTQRCRGHLEPQRKIVKLNLHTSAFSASSALNFHGTGRTVISVGSWPYGHHEG